MFFTFPSCFHQMGINKITSDELLCSWRVTEWMWCWKVDVRGSFVTVFTVQCSPPFYHLSMRWENITTTSYQCSWRVDEWLCHVENLMFMVVLSYFLQCNDHLFITFSWEERRLQQHLSNYCSWGFNEWLMLKSWCSWQSQHTFLQCNVFHLFLTFSWNKEIVQQHFRNNFTYFLYSLAIVTTDLGPGSNSRVLRRWPSILQTSRGKDCLKTWESEFSTRILNITFSCLIPIVSTLRLLNQLKLVTNTHMYILSFNTCLEATAGHKLT